MRSERALTVGHPMSPDRLLAAASALSLLVAPALAAESSGAEPALEKSFEAEIHPPDLGAWLKQMASEPNHVGSPHDRANAEFELAQFKAWGWDAHIETFDVLDPTPIAESLELLGPRPFKATLQEPPIPGDTSATATQPALPAYLEFQGDGDVTAPLVYVNYGMQEDYETLERQGVDVKGKIVIARYGNGFRGLKPLLAQMHGAVGCIIYSDPRDDGYSTDKPYPEGPARPPHGFQRGSVADIGIYAGDPLTPGVGATKDARRLKVSEAQTILKIPALPISYADAQPLLEAIGGNVAPAAWRGSLPITYRVGQSAAQVHLMVKSDWSLRPIYDVIAVMKGSTWPDQWVVRGNHHDGWVFGASDPLSGQVALMAEAKAMGALAAHGWRPKRTIVYASWDGEEQMLLGSTEWAETHAEELKAKAVIYINSDTNHRGTLSVDGSHDFASFVTALARDVADPETGVSVDERHRAKLRIDALQPAATEAARILARANAAAAADPSKPTPMGPLGGGSDYSAFLEHLGVPALNIEYTGEGDSAGVYHSRYDTYEHHSRFVDPGFVYDALMAKTIGRAVMRLADADLPQQRASDFADTISTYLAEVKKLADDRRYEAERQAGLLRDHAFRLAADPTRSSGDPTPLAPVPHFDLAPLESAVDRLKRSAAAYDSALARSGPGLSPERLARLQAQMQGIDQTLAPDVGLPGRSWYRNLIYAPGRFTGYGAKTLPGVREAIEDRRWADADRYAKLTADALNAYSDRLDQAAAVLNGG
jgi:N-acetylated-alpha-linked acidic dipeptidase